jgi:uncharacterized membrane protein
MSRIRSLDLARGFTVLCIPAIHSMLLYSQPLVRETLIGKMLKLIAEGPGAQLFMCLMGIYLSVAKTTSQRVVLMKGIIVFIAGYALNMLKFVMPNAFGWLPLGLMNDLEITNDGNAWWKLLLIGDIFHFAALALLLIGWIKQYKAYPYLAIVAVLIVLIISPLLWDVQTGWLVIDEFLKLIGVQPPRVFFPLFPWLVYPLSGLTIGYFLKRNAEETFRVLRDLGIILLLLPVGYHWLFPLNEPVSFYRTETPETLSHMGIVFVSLFVWYWMSEWVPGNRLFDVLQYSSRQITRLYIIQWIIIMWLLPAVGYQQHQLGTSILIIIVTTVLTYAISYLIDVYNEFASVTNK